MGDQEREVGRGDAAPTLASRARALRHRLPIIGAALGVVFIVSGVMRAILGLFGSSAASEPTTLHLCVSSTVGERTASELVVAFLQRQGGHNVDETSDPKTGELMLSTHLPGGLGSTQVSITTEDTATAFDQLANHDCHVALVSRELNPIEASQFHQVPAANLIALDGAVVVVHPSNPIHTLTLSEIRTIFAGDLTNWSEIGVASRAVHVLLPEKYSDEISLFTSRVLEGQVPTAHFQRSSDVALDVSGPRALGAIGLTTFHDSDPARFVHIIDGAGREFTPSTLSIGRRTYPLTIPVYAYRDETNMTNSAYQFLSFLDSSEGQNVLVDDGFVSPFAL